MKGELFGYGVDLEICNNFASHFCPFFAVPFRAVPLVNVTYSVQYSSLREATPVEWNLVQCGPRPRHQAKFSGPGVC